ncbi:MAG: STAS domain-containing protein [Candidatus Ozemobacteraceae bacterium]
MESFYISVKEVVPGIPVVVFNGYLAKQGGEKLQETLVPLLKSGKVNIVIDLAECKAISSPGIAALMEILMIITDDYKGKMVLSGLDNSKIMFLKMTGLLPLAQTASNVEDAYNLVL